MAHVTVRCAATNGVRLQLHGLPDVVLTGARRVGHGPHEPEGITHVDKSFWDEWYSRNSETYLVTSGVISVVSDAAAEGETENELV
jgi:hypothetical protein